jgi:hypothetical protein
VSEYREEVQKAIAQAMATPSYDDCLKALLEHAASDAGFDLDWHQPEPAQAILRSLIELGVRLGLQAAAAVASSRVQTGRPSSEGTVPIIGGADYHWVAQEIARLSPADVLRKP